MSFIIPERELRPLSGGKAPRAENPQFFLLIEN
jgi:hypothetical protein